MILYPSHLVFFSTLILSIILTLSRDSWFLVWIGLEINLLSFISLIFIKKRKYRTESSLKYFLIQVIPSIRIITCSLLNNNIYNITLYFMTIALIIKIGAAPLHQWLPSLIEGLSWNNIKLLLIFQKINPLFLILILLNFFYFLFFFIFFCCYIGAIGGLNQRSLRKLIVYSSISHLGWLLTANIITLIMCILYFFMYSIILYRLLVLFQENQSVRLRFLFIKKEIIIISRIAILSLAGLPPLIGFFPKLIIRQELIIRNRPILLSILLISTFFSLFYYMRISLRGILFSSYINYINLLNINNIYVIMLNIIGLILIPFILI